MLALGPYERINNLYRIRPKRPVPGEPSRMQFFRANKMQEHYLKNHTNRDLILKMRQGGVTTLSCLTALDTSLWEFGTHSAIIAHVKENVRKYFQISKMAFRSFIKDWGNFYPVTEQVDNVNELKIRELGSSLLVATETKGLTLDFLHIAEAAFVEDDRISESVESVPMSARVIQETTPDTASGMFYDTWMLGQNNEPSIYKNFFYPWWYQYPEEEDIPSLLARADNLKYTEEEEVLISQHNLGLEHIIWRRMKIAEKGGDKDEFNRLYPEDPLTCFLSGSRCVFPMSVQASLWRSEKKPAFTGDLLIA